MATAICVMLTSTACSQTKKKSLRETESKVYDSSMDFKLKETEIVDFDKLASFKLPVIVDYGSDYFISDVKMACAC